MSNCDLNNNFCIITANFILPIFGNHPVHNHLVCILSDAVLLSFWTLKINSWSLNYILRLLNYHSFWTRFYNTAIHFTFSEMQFVNLKFILRITPLFEIQFTFSKNDACEKGCSKMILRFRNHLRTNGTNNNNRILHIITHSITKQVDFKCTQCFILTMDGGIWMRPR